MTNSWLATDSISEIAVAQNRFRFVLPGAVEWWRSMRWVALVFSGLIALALIGSFVSYERVVREGHPWLAGFHCPGCPFCGMTRSFCAMSSGHWYQASEWNQGGPILYVVFWLWLFAAFVYGVIAWRGRGLALP